MGVDKIKEVPNPNSWLTEGFNLVQYPVRTAFDTDCPTCGFPEMGAVGKDFSDGVLRIICRHCGYDKTKDEYQLDVLAQEDEDDEEEQ